MRAIFLWVVVLALFGCSNNPQVEVGTPDSSKEEQPREEKQVSLTSQQMYQLILGELLVKKGDFNSAFNLIFPVAQETRDIGLVERSFHLSTNTFDSANIEKSANLWRSTEPDSSLAWRVGYLMALRNKNLTEALESWDSYREKSTVSLEEDLKNSSAQVSQSIESQIALEFFEKIYQKYPDEWSAGFAYAFIAEHYREPDLAVEILEETLESHDLPGEAYFLLANSYIASGQPNRGLQQLAPFIKKNPQDWSIQERYARLEVMAGKYQAAKARYENILNNNPQAYTSKLSLALLYIELDELSQAKTLLEQVVNIEGYQDVSQYYLGVIAHQKGNFRQAEHHLKQVTNPDYILDAQILMAQIKYDTLGLREALDVLDHIEVVNSEAQIKVWRARAILHAQVADFKTSANYYSKILEISNLPEVYYAKSMSLYYAKDFKAYESTLLEGLENYPEEPELLNALGYFYADENIKLTQSQELLDKALKLEPNSFHILDSRAWLAYRMQDFVLAEKLIEKSWQLYQEAESLIHLIKIKWALKKYQEAEKIWIREHQKYPDNQEVQDLFGLFSDKSH